jgi:hypothetical protein
MNDTLSARSHTLAEMQTYAYAPRSCIANGHQ